MTLLSAPQPDATQQVPACIELSAVSKTYHSRRGDVVALENVDLDIREGEFVSIVGPSGCGKSTLLRCVAGLATASAGTIAVRGKPVTDPVPDLGIVFQRDLLVDWRSV